MISRLEKGCFHITCSSDALFFFSSRRRHTRFDCDWSSDVCSSDLFYRRCLALRSRGAVDRKRSRLSSRKAYRARIERSGGKYIKACIQLGLGESKRSEERRVGKECRSRWSPDH